MAELIAPILDSFKQMLTAMTPDSLDPFNAVTSGFHGVLSNPPEAFVIPLRTSFPNQGEGSTRDQVHEITLKLGIAGSDPDELTANCIAYVKAVDAAIEDWANGGKFPVCVRYVYVVKHDYGMLWSKSGGGVAYFPELQLQVETEEL